MKLVLFSALLSLSINTWAKGISTHILDLSTGKGGRAVVVNLEVKEKNVWKKISSAKTDENGRVKMFEGATAPKKGMYRLTFDLQNFYKNSEAFFPEVTIGFKVSNEEEHYHVPLVLSPYGYSTYRGN